MILLQVHTQPLCILHYLNPDCCIPIGWDKPAGAHAIRSRELRVWSSDRLRKDHVLCSHPLCTIANLRIAHRTPWVCEYDLWLVAGYNDIVITCGMFSPNLFCTSTTLVFLSDGTIYQFSAQLEPFSQAGNGWGSPSAHNMCSCSQAAPRDVIRT
jgi:hypothetical protein